MNRPSFQKSIRASAGNYFSKASTFIARHLDNSIAARLAALLSRKALCASTKMIGVFFLTFCVYSFTIELLLSLFTSHVANSFTLYARIICALSSLPPVLSKGNVTTALTKSRIGEFICDILNVKLDAAHTYNPEGHISFGFVAGVLASALTLVFPFKAIVLSILLFIMLCIILYIPEAGPTFSFSLLFLADIRIQYLILGFCALSYVLKLLRRKRRPSLKKTDAVFAIFALATLGGVLISSAGNVNDSGIFFVLSVYFLGVLH